MGYRIRLGRISKKDSESLRGKSLEELEAGGRFTVDKDGDRVDDDDCLYYPKEHEQLYEIGKHIHFDKGREDFYDFELEETEFVIMSKEGLKAIIDWYHDKILEYHTELFNEIIADTLSDEGKKELMSYMTGKVTEWTRNSWEVYPYHLKEGKTDGAVVSSWKYEYSIFNITYIYRTFDWENDYLIYSGW